jgi:hypothetical protein
MIKHYYVTIEGSAADGQTWKTVSEMMCEFHDTFSLAMVESFQQLTKGQAVFGKPGVGCHGPYDIHKVTIERVKQ